jgi:hypothetical protein
MEIIKQWLKIVDDFFVSKDETAPAAPVADEKSEEMKMYSEYNNKE